MSTHHRKLKQILFSIGTTQYECQVQTITLNPGAEEGERMFALCPDGEFFEEPEAEPSLDVTFYADWTAGGISDFLWANHGQIANFEMDHHPDRPDEHVRFGGKLRVTAPPVGGEARTTELSEVTLQCLGQPGELYSRVGV